MKKQLLWCSVFAVLLSAAGTGIMTVLHREMTLELCADLCTAQDRLYGIDYQAKKQVYQIYQCSDKGTDAMSILRKAEQHDCRYVYDQVMYDAAAQQVYVHVSEFACGTGLIEQETVFRCDFQKQKLEPVWEIVSDTSNRTSPFAMTCMVQDGTLYYLAEDGDEAYQIYKQNGDTNTAVRKNVSSDSTIFSEYQFDADGMAYMFSTTGGLYREDENSILQPVSGTADVWNSYANPAWGETGVSYLDLTHQQLVSYSKESGKIKKTAMMNSYMQTEIDGQDDGVCVLDADMLTNHCLLRDGGFAAYAELPAQLRANASYLQSGLAIYQNGIMTLYPTLSYSGSYLWRRSGIWFLMMLGVASLLLITGFSAYAILRRKHYISIRLEMVLFAVLLFGSAIGVTSFAINHIMTESFNDSYQKVFDDLEQQICCELDTLLAQTKNFSSEETLFSEEFYIALDRIMQNTSIQNSQTGAEEFAPYFVFHALDADGNLVVLYNSSGKVQIPTSYTYDNSYLTQEYQTVLTEQIHQNLTQYDTEGAWNVQLCSYVNTEHGVHGVVEIGIDQYLTDWKTRQITSEIVQFTVLLCIIMVVVVIVFLNFSFVPIQQLGIQVVHGKVEKPVKSRWSSETSAIWEQLYVMIRNVRQRQEELEINNRQHYRFIPSQLVEMLGMHELADALPGIQRKCDLCLVSAVFQESSLEQVHQLYQEILPLIEQQGGILCNMDGSRAVWLFRRGTGNPLAVADQIRQTALQKRIACGVGVGSGTNTIFVRGTESCADIAVVGAEMALANRLAKLAVQQNQCLLTDAAGILADSLGWEKQRIHLQSSDICGYVLLHPVQDRDTQKIG